MAWLEMEKRNEKTIDNARDRDARGRRRKGVRGDLETLRAVGELVAAAFRLYGGTGRVGAVRLR